MDTNQFKDLVWQRGRELYRDMPWRDNTDPYYVLVSELMLQQTQVDRVIPKFSSFIVDFPDITALAGATLAEVIAAWSGLGYNRRAKFLHSSARRIVDEFNGMVPGAYEDLVGLPGVGPNTAGAILTYAFNQPIVFIETNIRTVYFHHFFADKSGVSDAELRAIVGETLDHENPRVWYQSLMDYGNYLKKIEGARLDQSKHYKKQSPLRGSVREVRGQIIKALTIRDMSQFDLAQLINADERFISALDSLQKDGLLQQTNGYLHLTK